MNTCSKFIHYAFGKTLMELLSLDEVCFCSEGNSRQEVDSELPGMFTIIFPVRLKRSDTLADCQAQLIFSAAHFHVFGISEPDFIAKLGKNCATLNVQNIFYDDEKTRQIMDFQTTSKTFMQSPALLKQMLLTQMDTRWHFNVYTNESLFFMEIYNGNYYEANFTRKFLQEFIKQLRLILKED